MGNRIMDALKNHSLTIINALLFFSLFTSPWLLAAACLLGLLQVFVQWRSHDPSHYKSTYVMLIFVYGGLLLAWIFSYVTASWKYLF